MPGQHLLAPEQLRRASELTAEVGHVIGAAVDRADGVVANPQILDETLTQGGHDEPRGGSLRRSSSRPLAERPRHSSTMLARQECASPYSRYDRHRRTARTSARRRQARTPRRRPRAAQESPRRALPETPQGVMRYSHRGALTRAMHPTRRYEIRDALNEVLCDSHIRKACAAHRCAAQRFSSKVGFSEPTRQSFHQIAADRRLRCNPLFVWLQSVFDQISFGPFRALKPARLRCRRTPQAVALACDAIHR